MIIGPIAPQSSDGASKSSGADVITGLSEAPKGIKGMVKDAVRIAKEIAPKGSPRQAIVTAKKESGDKWSITIQVTYTKGGEKHFVNGNDLAFALDPMQINQPTHQAITVTSEGNTAIISARQR